MILVILTLCFVGCFDRADPIQCEHELCIQGHFLEIPVSINPTRQTYQVGDTIEVSLTFQDSIYDFGACMNFKIEDMPLRPISSLYRIIKDESTSHFDYKWESGFRGNEIIIDTVKYDHLYQYFTSVSDNIRADIVYNQSQGMYEYSYQVVLNSPGVYFFHARDILNDIGGSKREEHRAYQSMINNVEWEGKCPAGIRFWYTLQHDGHYYEYLEELQYLDATLGQNFESIDDDLGLGDGNSHIERIAFFGFEVVE